MGFYAKKCLAENHTTGTSSDGSRLSALQSFKLRSDSPLAVMSKPPTISNSDISASLMALLDNIVTQ